MTLVRPLVPLAVMTLVSPLVPLDMLTTPSEINLDFGEGAATVQGYRTSSCK